MSTNRNSEGFILDKQEKMGISLTFWSDVRSANKSENKTPDDIDDTSLFSKDPNYEGEDCYFSDEDVCMEDEFL